MVIRQKNPVNITALLMFVVLNVVGLFSNKITEWAGIDKYTLCIILYLICFLIPTVLLAVMQRKEIKIKSYLQLKSFKLRYVPVSVASGVTATLFCLLLNGAIVMLFNIKGNSTFPTVMGDIEINGVLPVAFAVVLLPAICEELFFRGAYCSQFSDEPRIEVILASALCFTMLHGSLANLVSPFVCGIVYCFLVYVTGSIWSAIIAHLTNNVIAVTAAYYSEALSVSELKYAIYVVSLIIFFISLYMTLRLFEKYYLKSKKRRKKINKKETNRRRNRQTPFTASFFVLVALFVLKLVFEITGFWA